MTEVTNNDIYGVLLGIKEDIGETKQKLISTTELLANHIGVDTVVQGQLRSDITAMQLDTAKQRGFLAALAAVGGVVGTGLGFLLGKH